MRSDARLTGSPAIAGALALFGLLSLAGCATPPSGIPTAQSIRGLKPSGKVTMTQAFVVGTGVGSGTLTFEGRTYSFTLIGSLTGLGALSTLQASGEVYKLKDVSQFSGAYIPPGHGQPCHHHDRNGRTVARESEWRDHAPDCPASRLDLQLRAVRDLYRTDEIGTRAPAG